MKKVFVAWVIFLYGCSPEIRTYSDSDKEYPVQNYRTYQWAQENEREWQSNPLYYNELTDKRIKGAVNDLLAVKGYVLSDSAAELSLHYHIVVEERSMLAPDPYGYFYGDWWMEPRENIFKYREGTLILDVVKTQTRHLIWRGWAVAAIEVVLYDVKNTDVIIKSAITKILMNFPESVGRTPDTVTVR
jgi:uncharacterized protein YceK